MLKYIIALILISNCISFGQDESWKIYDDSEVARIDITVDPEDLTWMYSHPGSDSMHVAAISFQNALINETVDSIGFRIRGNTSRISHKKSRTLFTRHRQNHLSGKRSHSGPPPLYRRPTCGQERGC